MNARKINQKIDNFFTNVSPKQLVSDLEEIACKKKENKNNIKIQIDIELDPRAIELINLIEERDSIDLFDLENMKKGFYNVFKKHKNILFYVDYECIEQKGGGLYEDVRLTPTAKQAIAKYRELKRQHENNN